MEEETCSLVQDPEDKLNRDPPSFSPTSSSSSLNGFSLVQDTFFENLSLAADEVDVISPKKKGVKVSKNSSWLLMIITFTTLAIIIVSIRITITS